MIVKLPHRVLVILPAILRLVAIGVVAVIIGVTVGMRAALWFAVLAFGVLLAVHLFYVALLADWLEKPVLDTIPDGMGTWSEVFTRLYKMHRASERNARRLEDNEERFRRTISALPEGIVLVDAALQIEWCNPVAERHLGLHLQADQGLRLINLVRDPAFVAYMTSRSFDAPLLFRPLVNPDLALSVNVIEFEPARSIVITRDVTQSERVDAMRRDFIANVSHELRTPLTVVNGFLETMLDADGLPGDVAIDPAQRRHHMTLMLEQAQRMHRLVEDLLTLSRLESQENPVPDEDVDVPQLVRETADEARALSHGRHTIAVDCDVQHVRGSRDELRSAFGNLVSNAIRYTPAGGRISLAWKTDLDGGHFSVSDTGIGIAPDHVPRLTERFYRVDKSRSRETGGTGLGLAIVKHVLMRHDGRLDVESRLGEGSVFTATLPRARLILTDANAQRRAA
jgi:two-component system phosphate regulon sensor histidine kinase PhoR